MTDKLALWNAVSKTNPANTKKVSQRGGFTSICAQSQIMEATRQFGPIGIGWGYEAAEPIFHDNLVFVRVMLWHGSRENSFGPVTGGAEWKNNKGYLDSDAPKKATTDALTKLLSQLGFNADVFLGLFDDNKYVKELEREFAEPRADTNGFTPPVELVTDAQRDEITLMAQGAGVPLKAICDAAHVDSLKDLPAAKFASVIKKLKATMAKNAEQKESA